MGADRFLDEERHGLERELQGLTHVVVVTQPGLEVYGPYRRGKANTMRVKIMASYIRGPRQVKVRALKTFEETDD